LASNLTYFNWLDPSQRSCQAAVRK